MSREDRNEFNVDSLLMGLFKDKLVKLFEKRIDELGISPTNALDVLDIEYRALQGILYGTSKRVDMMNFIKLASFLKITKEAVIELYFNELEENGDDIAYPKDRVEFLNANFDLAALYRAGFIESITEYPKIEEKIKLYFGLNSIFEYKLPVQHVAFSAGSKQPKNFFTRAFWINAAISAFTEINNPYPYNLERLMAYFPEIRQQCVNVEDGLINVINNLFELGVTVFYQSSLPSLYLKGATLEVNHKPCIIITDYKGFYTTFWHTLCHELSHVLFDFEEIRRSRYHISEESSEDMSVSEKEYQADTFARQYLFSSDKLKQAKPHINNRKFIKEFAGKNHVHPCFIYTYYAFEFEKEDNKAWAKARTNNPSVDGLIKKIENPWTKSKGVKRHINSLKEGGLYK